MKLPSVGVLLVALLTIAALTATPAVAQPSDPYEAKYNMLLKVVDNVKDKIEDSLKVLEEFNVTLPGNISSAYSAALELVEEAVNLSAVGTYEEAVDKLLTALKELKDVFKAVEEIVEQYEGAEEVADAAERFIGLRVAIERAYNFSYKIELLANASAEEGYNVSSILALLAEARELLANASALLDEGAVSDAAKTLAAARKLLGLAMAELHKLTKDIKVKRVGKIIAKIEKELEDVRKRVIQALDKVPEPIKAMLNKTLMQIMNKTLCVKKTLEVKEIAKLMKELKTFKKGVEDLEKQAKKQEEKQEKQHEQEAKGLGKAEEKIGHEKRGEAGEAKPSKAGGKEAKAGEEKKVGEKGKQEAKEVKEASGEKRGKKAGQEKQSVEKGKQQSGKKGSTGQKKQASSSKPSRSHGAGKKSLSSPHSSKKGKC